MSDFKEQLSQHASDSPSQEVALFDLQGRCLSSSEGLLDMPALPAQGSARFADALQRLVRGEAMEEVFEELSASGDRRIERTLLRMGDRIIAVARDASARQRAEALALRSSQLQQLTAALSAAVTREEVIRVAVEDARRVAGAGAAFFGLVDLETRTVRLQGAVGLSQELEQSFSSVPLDANTALASVVREGKPLLLQLSAFRRVFPHIAPLWERAGYRSGVGVPLTVGGDRIGAFGLLFHEERGFSADEQQFLLTLGELCGQALQRARLYAEARAAEERSRRDAERLRLLSDISRALAEATLDHESVLRTAARISAEAVGDSCLLSLVSEDRRHLHFAAIETRHEWMRDIVRELRAINERNPMSAQDGRTGQVLRTGRPLRENDLVGPYQGVSEPSHRATLARLPVHAALLVPVRVSSGILGVLSVARYEPGRPYTEEDEAFLQEIADRAAVAVEKTRLYRETQEAVRVRDDFLSIASHELKTPLTTALFQLEGLDRQARQGPGAGGPQLATRVQGLRRQVWRLQSLIERLLDVSHLTAGQLPLEAEDVDLAALARDVLERLSADAARAGSLFVLRAPAPVVGRWDRLRVDSVVTNLVSNAVKYGAGAPVEVTVGVEGPRAHLIVRDHGIGIAVEQQARIFSKFERAVSHRHYGGLGLGLWIARQVVERHGGTIEVVSAPGEGATFTVHLPLQGPPGASAAPAPGPGWT